MKERLGVLFLYHKFWNYPSNSNHKQMRTAKSNRVRKGERTMTREQCKQFISQTFGIEPDNVTDEQISAYLNNVNGQIKSEKDRADALKAEAEKAKTLQAQLDAIEAEKLSDIEKANKETEKANNQIASLQSQIKQMQTRTKLAELGIVGEQADKFFGANGEIDFEVLGQVISEREKKASDLKEKELLDKTPNPNGGGSSTPEKTEAEIFAENYGKSLAESNKVASDIMSHYTN